MERCLVRAQVNFHAAFGEAFPEVDNIALIGKRDRLFGFHCAEGAVDEFVEISVNLVNPSLRVAFFDCRRVDFSGDADNARDFCCLRLSARHAAETGRNK